MASAQACYLSQNSMKREHAQSAATMQIDKEINQSFIQFMVMVVCEKLQEEH